MKCSEAPFDELSVHSAPSLPSDVEDYLHRHITATVRGEGQKKSEGGELKTKQRLLIKKDPIIKGFP